MIQILITNHKFESLKKRFNSSIATKYSLNETKDD